MPIYLDGIGDKLNQMKELDVKDFMQYYTKYNSERSIEDSIQMKYFAGWVTSERLDDIIDLFDPSYANKAKKLNMNTGAGETSKIKFNSPNSGEQGEYVSKAPGAGPGRLEKDSKEYKNKQAKATNMLKCILYFSLCLNDCWTLDDMIKQCKADKSVERMAGDFGLSLQMLELIRSRSNSIELNEIDSEIHNIAILMNDKNRSPLENIQIAINKMG